MTEPIERAAAKVADIMAEPGYQWKDQSLKSVHEVLNSPDVPASERKAIMQKACSQLQEKGLLPGVTGTWGDQQAWFLDRDRDGKITRKELLEAAEDPRCNPIDAVMTRAILDQYSYIQERGFELPPDEEKKGAKGAKLFKDEPITPADLKWYGEHARMVESWKSAGSASPGQLQEFDAKRRLAKQAPTELEKLFGSADLIIGSFDTNNDGKMSAAEVLKACESLKSDSGKAQALQTAYLGVIAGRTADSADSGVSARDLIRQRANIDKLLKK